MYKVVYYVAAVFTLLWKLNYGYLNQSHFHSCDIWQRQKENFLPIKFHMFEQSWNWSGLLLYMYLPIHLSAMLTQSVNTSSSGLPIIVYSILVAGFGFNVIQMYWASWQLNPRMFKSTSMALKSRVSVGSNGTSWFGCWSTFLTSEYLRDLPSGLELRNASACHIDVPPMMFASSAGIPEKLMVKGLLRLSSTRGCVPVTSVTVSVKIAPVKW